MLSGLALSTCYMRKEYFRADAGSETYGWARSSVHSHWNIYMLEGTLNWFKWSRIHNTFPRSSFLPHQKHRSGILQINEQRAWVGGCSCVGDFALWSICLWMLGIHVYIFFFFLNPTDLTHMNEPAADRFGCWLLMHGREDSVQVYFRYEEKQESPCLY